MSMPVTTEHDAIIRKARAAPMISKEAIAALEIQLSSTVSEDKDSPFLSLSSPRTEIGNVPHHSVRDVSPPHYSQLYDPHEMSTFQSESEESRDMRIQDIPNPDHSNPDTSDYLPRSPCNRRERDRSARSSARSFEQPLDGIAPSRWPGSSRPTEVQEFEELSTHTDYRAVLPLHDDESAHTGHRVPPQRTEATPRASQPWNEEDGVLNSDDEDSGEDDGELFQLVGTISDEVASLSDRQVAAHSLAKSLAESSISAAQLKRQNPVPALLQLAQVGHAYLSSLRSSSPFSPQAAANWPFCCPVSCSPVIQPQNCLAVQVDSSSLTTQLVLSCVTNLATGTCSAFLTKECEPVCQLLVRGLHEGLVLMPT